MAYDEILADRVREALADEPLVDERKMFGGLAFMVNGHMCCGVDKERLMVRVGPGAYEDALSEAHARPMDFTGKPLRGFVYVEPSGYGSASDLQLWVDRGRSFVHTLPPK